MEPIASIINGLDMNAIRDHYLGRERAHSKLWSLFSAKAVHDFVQLALGISDPSGNYSAAEHALAPRILTENTEDEVFGLASKINGCSNVHHLPDLIYREKLPFLKISVGSEIAMMLKPQVHWVGNVRTIWSHLLIKHKGDRSRANQELSLYRDGERDSEMEYQIGRDVYLALEQNLLLLERLATEAATARNVTPGPLRFMWADAVANELYDRFGDAGRKARVQSAT